MKKYIRVLCLLMAIIAFGVTYTGSMEAAPTTTCNEEAATTFANCMAQIMPTTACVQAAICNKQAGYAECNCNYSVPSSANVTCKMTADNKFDSDMDACHTAGLCGLINPHDH